MLNKKVIYQVIFCLFISLLGSEAKAQEEKYTTPQSTDDPSIIFVSMFEYSEFIGGNKKFIDLFVKNFKRPKGIPKDKAFELVIDFVVMNDGSVSDIKVVKSYGQGTAEEAKRVLESLPKWKPARQNNRATSEKKQTTIIIPAIRSQRY